MTTWPQKTTYKSKIECKFASGDIGRQIHLKRLYQFGEYVTPQLQALLSRICGGIFVHVTISGRLNGQERQHASISEQMCNAIEAQEGQFEFSDGQISVSRFALENSPFETQTPQFLSRQDVDQFVSRQFGVENRNMLIIFRPHRHAVIVVLQGSKEDRVLTGIHRQLKEAARKQFTRSLPAVLCCQLADLHEHELMSLRYKDDRGLGLDYMTSDLIVRRPQLLAVTYTAPGSLAHETSFDWKCRATVTQRKGTSLHHPESKSLLRRRLPIHPVLSATTSEVWRAWQRSVRWLPANNACCRRNHPPAHQTDDAAGHRPSAGVSHAPSS